jgi:MFS family permease
MDRSRPTGLVIAVLALAGLVVAVMQTLLVPLIPELPQLLGVSPEDASWLVTATLLAGAVATPSLSRLADMWGKRRMMLASLAAMTAGSVVAAMSSSLPLLVTGRALQGCGMALIPIAISIMRDELPRERLGAAVALVSATLGIGAAVGLPLSGIVYENLGWHALFWLSAATGVVMAVAVWTVIPESRIRSGGSFDLTGAVLLSGVLIGLLLGITKGGTWGWTSTSTLLSFAVSAGLLALWLPWELRVRQPLVDVRTAARRPVLLTNIASFLAGFAMYCNMLTTTEILQLPTTTGYGFGLPITTAGLAMLPAGLTMVVMAPVSATITRRFGARTTLIVGAVALAAGYVLRVFLMDEIWQIILGAIIVSTGTAIAYAAMPILIMRGVPATETAAANGLNMVLRSVGTSTASAAVAAILTAVTITVGGLILPSQQAFQHVFVIAASAAAAAALVALAIPRRAQPAGPQTPGDQLRPPGADDELVASGRVVDAAARPLASAVVSVATVDGESVDWARTDAEGRFTVAVPRWGRFVLVASAPGWASTAVVTELTDGPALTVLQLDRAVRLTGHVHGARSGATVTVVDGEGQVCAATHTDEAGAFALPLPAAGGYVVAAVDGHSGVAVDVVVGSDALDVDLRLAAVTRP